MVSKSASASDTLTRAHSRSTKQTVKRRTSTGEFNVQQYAFEIGVMFAEVLEKSQAANLAALTSIRATLEQLATLMAARPASKEASDGLTVQRRDAMLAELNRASGASAEAYVALAAQGEAARVEWTKNGSLVPSTALAKSWGLTRQGLTEAEGRHELFFLKIGGRLWAPAVFGELPRDAVKAVCAEMPDADAESQLFFWTRTQGGLGGKTVAQSIRAGQLARVVEIARGLAEENGWNHAAQVA